MSNTIDTIKESNTILLKSYKKLLVDYDQSRQASEKIVNEYESSIVSETIVMCSQIVAYTYNTRVIKWGIVLLNDTLVYESDSTSKYDTWHLQLKELNLPPGTLFRLRANLIANGDFFSDQILQYEVDSSTLFFRFDEIDHDPYIGPVYDGSIASSASPPILKCSKITGDNQGNVIIRWEIRTLSENKTIYTSKRYTSLSSNWSKPLSELNITPGTLLRLHANVSSGDDSEPYVILEYDPTSTKNAKFTLGGTAFKTYVMYNA